MIETVDDIRSRLKKRYADDPDTLEWIDATFAELDEYPLGRALQLARGAESDLLSYA